MTNLFACLAATALTTATAQEQATAVFRVDVKAVQLDVFVEHRGKAVPNLEASDFEVYDNGVRQNVVRVEAGSAPLDVVLVLDLSTSVRGYPLDRLKEAGMSLVSSLDADDRLGFVGFSSGLSPGRVWMANRDELSLRMQAASAAGFTALHDAVFAALVSVTGKSRPLLVLFTDGNDNFSWLTDEEVLEAVRHSNAVVEVVAVAPAAASLPKELRERQAWFLNELAEAGGGRLWRSDSVSDFERVFRLIAAQMKTRYLLTYYPEHVAASGWHELEVKVADYGVTARRGYYVTGENR